MARLIAATVLSFAGWATPAAEFPEQVRVMLEGADRFELLSINPEHDAKGKDLFYGWAVLGRTEIADRATRAELVAAFRKGVEENPGIVARCFNPRHGIRAAQGGKLIELVICFECNQAEVYVDGQGQKGLLTTNSPEPTFDRVLRAARSR